MKKLNDYELKEISGGFSGWVAVGIAIAATFIAGVLDGQTKP